MHRSPLLQTLRPAILAVGVALLGGCGAGEPQMLTFDKYLAACKSVLGKPVRVAGYLGKCGGYDCMLFANESEWQAEQAALRDPKANRFPRYIGIGGNPESDDKASHFQNSYVVITGRVDDHECTGEGGLDRVVGIEPTDIRAWTPSEGAPANTPTNTH